MVHACRDLGLEVVEGDALRFLRHGWQSWSESGARSLAEGLTQVRLREEQCQRIPDCLCQLDKELAR